MRMREESFTDDAIELISHARKMGVRNLSFSRGKLKVEFYPVEGETTPGRELEDPGEKPVKRQVSREEDITGGLLSGDDARTLMNPYHDLNDD